MFARHFIDSLDFANHGRELKDVVPLAELPRLQDVLAAPVGEISYAVRGMQGKDGKPMLEVTIGGVCQLRCQRCLNGFAYPVQLVSRLLLVPPGELNEFSADESDEMDSISADKHLDVLDVIEEEILLNLPFAPMHPSGECQAAEKESGSSAKSPFAVLAGLKDK